MRTLHFFARATGLLLSALLLLSSGNGCSDGGTYGPELTQRSTSAVLSLPHRERFVDSAREKLTGYRLDVRAIGGTCKQPAPIDQANRWTTTNVVVKLVQGCDYSIGVELGSIEDEKQRLKTVFFTNIDSSGRGKILGAGEIANKLSVSVKVELGMTEAGRQAGFDNQNIETPAPNPEPDSSATDVTIDVAIDAGTSGPPTPANPDATAPTKPDATAPAEAGSSAESGPPPSGGGKPPAGIDCTKDVQPPTSPEFTCAQQAEWGKCKEDFMKEYCHISCGRCKK